MYAKKKSVSMKVVVLMMALVLLVGCTIGGTLAWLAMKTDPVVNTFTAGNINITLTETGTTDNAKSFTMVPGVTYAKDPVVTVEAGSEPCWLFIKIEESANVGQFLSYSPNDTDWTFLESRVYYASVDAKNEAKTLYVLADSKTPDTADDYDNGCVTVLETVTKEEMDTITEANAPKLTFTAYAVQKEGFATAALAWDHAKTLS